MAIGTVALFAQKPTRRERLLFSKLGAFVVGLLFVAQSASAQLVYWNFSNSPFGTNVYAPTSYSTNFQSAPVLSFGGGGNDIKDIGVVRYFYGTQVTNAANALSQNVYLQLSLVPQAGSSITVTGFTLNLSALPNTNYLALFSSIDGYATTNQIGSPLFATTSSDSNPQQLVFSGFTNVITNLTTYRFYFYGGVGTNSVSFGNSANPSVNAITVNGVPEVKTGLLLTFAMIGFALFSTTRMGRSFLKRRIANSESISKTS